MPATERSPRLARWLCLAVFAMALCACSTRELLVKGVADELAQQGQAAEDDLVLAREASAFYLKLSESLLRQDPGNLPLAQAVSAGYTQYAYAFVAFEAERLSARDSKASLALRERAARLYLRAQRHAMAALEHSSPGFARTLSSDRPTDWPKLSNAQLGLAYWGAAAWGGYISLSKDDPDALADLPVAMRLARLAWERSPEYGEGALASLMGSFEAARPGGSVPQAQAYFDLAVATGAGRSAGPLVAQAESIALPGADRAAFEALLRQALQVSAQHRSLQNEVMRERAQWLLASADDLF